MNPLANIPGNQLTQRGLMLQLYYNSKTGCFVRVKALSNSVNVGEKAGCICRGYRSISVKGKQYQAHRLAWLYMTGEWPKNQIDHKNHNRDDNRWCNLRSATHQEKGKNQKLRKTNKSGVTGVHWSKEKKKWLVNIMVNGKTKHIGYFTSIIKAKKARCTANTMFGFHENHGKAL